MPTDWGVLFHLDNLRYDAFGRVLIGDRDAASRLAALFDKGDALACRSGCGAPLSCDTALIARDELVGLGPDLLINNPDFGTIIRKRKAVGAQEAVIVFTVYRKVDLDSAA